MHSFRRLTTAGFKCSKLIRLSWLKANVIAFLREPMEEMGWFLILFNVGHNQKSAGVRSGE